VEAVVVGLSGSWSWVVGERGTADLIYSLVRVDIGGIRLKGAVDSGIGGDLGKAAYFLKEGLAALGGRIPRIYFLP